MKGITFDFYKTLGERTKPTPSFEQLSDILVDKEYPVYPQELEAARNYVFFHDFEHHTSWQEWWGQIFRRLDFDPPDQKTLTELIPPPLELYPGIPELMKQLEDYRLSIVTTVPPFMFEPAIADIKERLVAVTTGYSARCAKGNPRMYLLDLELKKLKATESLFVGNDPLYDIKYPKKLGMATIHITIPENSSEFADW